MKRPSKVGLAELIRSVTTPLGDCTDCRKYYVTIRLARNRLQILLRDNPGLKEEMFVNRLFQRLRSVERRTSHHIEEDMVRTTLTEYSRRINKALINAEPILKKY